MQSPFIEFPDMARMTDRQLALLLLYEMIEVKAELRAIGSLLLQAHKPVWTVEQYNNVADKAQDGAIAEMVEHARQLMQSPQKPPLN